MQLIYKSCKKRATDKFLILIFCILSPFYSDPIYLHINKYKARAHYIDHFKREFIFLLFVQLHAPYITFNLQYELNNQKKLQCTQSARSDRCALFIRVEFRPESFIKCLSFERSTPRHTRLQSPHLISFPMSRPSAMSWTTQCFS